jgi:thiosulfate dehydrogenase [quinone] large subunit
LLKDPALNLLPAPIPETIFPTPSETTMSKECCSETAKESSAGSSGESCCPTNTLGLVYGSLLLRLWLGVRAIQTGVEKYAGTRSGDQVVPVDGVANEEGLTAAGSLKYYTLENYHGVPAALMKKFEAEPLMMKFALPLYDKVLGPALIILGLGILLGLAYRSSLFLLGLLYISLTWGLILIKQDDGVSWLATHMILVVAALALAQHNRLAILKKW